MTMLATSGLCRWARDQGPGSASTPLVCGNTSTRALPTRRRCRRRYQSCTTPSLAATGHPRRPTPSENSSARSRCDIPDQQGDLSRTAFVWPGPRRLGLGGQVMSEPAASNDQIERANAQFWTPPSLEELMADVAPLEADEHFDIPDVTDEEWDVFVAALDE